MDTQTALVHPASICTAILRRQPDIAEANHVVKAFRAYEQAHRKATTPEGMQHALDLMRAIPEQYLTY